MRLGLNLLALCAILLAPLGCDGPNGPPDGGAEGCPEADPWESGGDGSSDLAVPVAAGRAVAGRITSEEQLLRGLKPRGRVGDFLMANDRIALVVEDARPSDGYGVAGGEILDVDLMGPEGPVGESLFGEMLLGILPEVVAPEQVTVLADGRDGGPAIVRASGRLTPMWVLEDCCGAMFASRLGLPAAIDYVLEPGSAAIEVRMTVRNESETVHRPESVLTVLIGGDGARRYAPTVGFDERASFGVQPWIALVADRIGYAWTPAEGQVRYLVSYSGFHVYDGPAVDLPGCADTTLTLGHLVVAGGDTSSIQSELRRVRGEPEAPAITGTVSETDGTPVRDARVHLAGEDGVHRSMGRTDEAGRYRIEVEPGAYSLQAWATDRRPTETRAVTVGEADQEIDFALGPAGVLAWTVVDGEGREIPAKVSVRPLDEPAPTAHASFGERRHPAGAMHHAFALPGRTEVVLPAGRYRVVATRGYEYEVDQIDVEVVADDTVEVAPVLVRSVDTTGWLAGDFHVHTMYSPDSNDLLEWKVAASAAVGLEIPVCTDHRWIGDLQPTVEALGLDAWVRWFPGHEVTTFAFGHFNAYPLVPRPSEPNMGAFDVAGRRPDDLLGEIRAHPTSPILQINHPRGEAISAYFSYVGLDPETLEVRRPDDWTTDFDAIEVWNSDDWLETREGTVRDWLGMLRGGHVVTATGNSDSHDAEWSDIGYPRNYVALGEVSPRDVGPDELRDAVRAGRVVVSGGLFVTVETLDGVGPGGVAPAPGGTARVRVRVQAPSWMDADGVEVIVDGVTVEQIALDESTEDPEDPVVRLDRELELAFDSDGWVVVGAWSEGSLSPATEGHRPFGATNAVYFDVDGDGEYRDTGLTVR